MMSSVPAVTRYTPTYSFRVLARHVRGLHRRLSKTPDLGGRSMHSSSRSHITVVSIDDVAVDDRAMGSSFLLRVKPDRRQRTIPVEHDRRRSITPHEVEYETT